jgi:hypothetical protein
MDIRMRLECGGRTASRTVIGAALIIGVVAGCKTTSIGASSPTSGATTAAPSASATSASGTPAPAPSKTKPRGTTHQSPTAQPSSTSPAATPTTTSSATAPPSMPAPSGSAGDPTAPAQATSQAPDGTVAFSASCAAHASSSASGCGAQDAGPSSGQAPGFAAGQQSTPNLLGINQDPWTGSQGLQVLNASSFQNWSVTATDTDPSNAAGEVLTYPDASFNYYQLNTPASGYTIPPAQYNLNQITSLTSDFAESMPQVSDLNAEAAYDLWLNNWQTEVMVWVDTSPAKDRNLADDGMTKVGTYAYGGQNFALWREGNGITGFYVFLLDHNETSGTVDLKAMLQTMVSLGYIPAASPLTQIPFGWEISDTGGKPVTFSLSKFDVNLQN